MIGRRRRKICVLTGTRAEYSLLKELMRQVQHHPQLELRIIVTAAHLAPQFGETWREIEADGFQVDEKVDMLLADDNPLAIAKSLGLGIIGLSESLNRLKPDILVLLGDRYEILAAAQGALLLGLPIAHIHGGEVTQGALDDAIRHAITKIAQLHFVAAEPYRQRVIQLGELPNRVITVGGMALDAVVRLKRLSRAELERALGLIFQRPLFVVTCHPETSSVQPVQFVDAVLNALAQIQKGTIIFTGSNADAHGQQLWRRIVQFCDEHSHRCRCIVNLGEKYFSLIREADVVIGNSSSGLLEAPILGTPTVNIGARQHGRLRAPSVIDCAATVDAISGAIERALQPEMKSLAVKKATPYGRPGAAKRIIQHLLSVDLTKLHAKNFYDIESNPS
jgi:UDP-hydrolysing UDP-N-acetyl-D-glucosamine 2-epimerase